MMVENAPIRVHGRREKQIGQVFSTYATGNRIAHPRAKAKLDVLKTSAFGGGFEGVVRLIAEYAWSSFPLLYGDNGVLNVLVDNDLTEYLIDLGAEQPTERLALLFVLTPEHKGGDYFIIRLPFIAAWMRLLGDKPCSLNSMRLVAQSHIAKLRVDDMLTSSCDEFYRWLHRSQCDNARGNFSAFPLLSFERALELWRVYLQPHCDEQDYSAWLAFARERLHAGIDGDVWRDFRLLMRQRHDDRATCLANRATGAQARHVFAQDVHDFAARLESAKDDAERRAFIESVKLLAAS